jgi:hypothetical protein
MIKCLRDKSDDSAGGLCMVGTMIQRCVNDPRITIDEDGCYRFWYDLSDEERASHIESLRRGTELSSAGGIRSGARALQDEEGKAVLRGLSLLMKEDPTQRPFFQYRVNETPYEDHRAIRKVTIVRCALDDETDEGISVPCSVTNMTVCMPTIIRSVYNCKPFQISTCEAMIEVSGLHDRCRQRRRRRHHRHSTAAAVAIITTKVNTIIDTEGTTPWNSPSLSLSVTS